MPFTEEISGDADNEEYQIHDLDPAHSDTQTRSNGSRISLTANKQEKTTETASQGQAVRNPNAAENV